MHVQVELHKAKKITYHEQGAAPAPSVSDIHPISHEAFAKRQHKILELITRGKQNKIQTGNPPPSCATFKSNKAKSSEPTPQVY